MWRRVASLSPLVSSTKPSTLNQGLCTFKFWETFTTEIAATQEKPFITFVLGGPGSGKGTQCEKIVETFGFKHLSAGDLLRREIASKSEYGSMILNTIREGKIVPSQVTVKLIQREMESSDNKKFIIDGFPRSQENRIAFEKINTKTLSDLSALCSKVKETECYIKEKSRRDLMKIQTGAEPNLVLFFDCPEKEMVKRVLSRNQGRVDDNIDTMKKRLKVFEALNRPVINYYSEKGKVFKSGFILLLSFLPFFSAHEFVAFVSKLTSNGNLCLQINAVGTVDEIFEQVRPIFTSCR
ncbi:Adenylate kinase/UMP-CMP kinase [Parasponia andersonii]|uniref:adenylate kinase n=1 Tax=Parasponia andersonii TaxID=3476 RepID=A0A2P5C588_PARAD|nr:Adenylate kinase/UMP-CMP kinase [Parasponia andersonii]